jgi:hypothetical protein
MHLAFPTLAVLPLSFFPLVAATGSPDYPDLTHPDTLITLGKTLLAGIPNGLWLLGGLGVMLALFNFSFRQQQRPDWMSALLARYGRLLNSLPHVALIVALTLSGSLLCTTLANRYHYWELDRVSRVSESVAGERGERIEHNAPQMRYEVDEPYVTFVQDRGRPIEVTRYRKIPRFLTLASSQVKVNLQQMQEPNRERYLYQADFSGDYQVRNTLRQAIGFTFEAPPPSGYTLLDGYRVERDGKLMYQQNPGDYGFPLRLRPGELAKLRVTYKVQGGPRWVYSANGQLLSNFKLTADANFANAEFASGILPASTENTAQGKRFTWSFKENVAVRNPFGVFTSTQRISNRGFLPRLLVLAPLILLWWLGLLYLSVSISLRDLILAAGLFFAMLLALTYLSRTYSAPVVWSLLSIVFLVLSWGLGASQASRRLSLAAVIATLCGAVLPVLGLLVTYSGLTLSVAGILSVTWLVLQHWYLPSPRLVTLSPEATSTTNNPDVTGSDNEDG